LVQEYAAATAEAEMAEAKAVRQGEEAEAFKRIADEKRLLAYQLADKWTGETFMSCKHCLSSEESASVQKLLASSLEGVGGLPGNLGCLGTGF